MKKIKHILSVLLMCCMAVELMPMTVMGATSVDFGNSTYGAYAVEGGNIYIDAKKGMIVDCDKSVTAINDMPSRVSHDAIDGTNILAGFSTVSYIGERAFDDCSNLVSITISDRIADIGGFTFNDCSSLTRITVNEENKWYTSVDGVLFDKNCEMLIRYPQKRPNTSYTVPEGVTDISICAFQGCTSVTSICIANSVECIRAWSFYGCSSLTDISIPNSVDFIGDDAFFGCSALTDVYYGGSEEDWKSISIKTGNTCLTKATIHYNSNGTGSNSNTTVPTPTTSDFSDVQPAAYYYDSVKWAMDQGITTGTTATTFSPEQTCTRAQILTFLWRAAGSPEPNGTASFSDISSNAYYAKAAAWAAEQGLVKGNTLAADTPCTRLEAVEYMWKYDGSSSSPNAGFSDVKSPAVDWAVNEGVTNGTGSTTFSPEQTCTRAQIVTFLYRAFA